MGIDAGDSAGSDSRLVLDSRIYTIRADVAAVDRMLDRLLRTRRLLFGPGHPTTAGEILLGEAAETAETAEESAESEAVMGEVGSFPGDVSG